MRILVTNDDSVNAAQLIPLIKWCQKHGEVTVIVPKVEQSGKSQGIELHRAFEVRTVDLVPGVVCYTVDSTPADCIRYAVLGLHLHFDLVVSGINRGFNLGRDIMYSGTAGAVFEAVSLGIQAIAVSTSPDNYDYALEQMDTVYAYIQKYKLMELNDLYNINIPPEPKGILITKQGGHYYSDDFIDEGDGHFKPHGKCVYQNTDDLTLDTDAVMHGYISIMPLTINRTNLAVYDALQKL